MPAIKSFRAKLIISYFLVIIVTFVIFYVLFRADSAELAYRYWVALLYACLCAFVAGSLSSRMITRPVKRLAGALRKLSEGDFNQSILVNPNDELAAFADALNAVSLSVERKVRELNSQHQELSGILRSMIEGVIVVDSAGHIISLNPSIEKIFGVSSGEVKGKLFLEAIRNNDLSDLITAVLDKQKPISREISLVLPVQGVFQVNVVSVSEHGSVSGALIVIHDVTEIRRLETMRKDFVANVSHELKTPLTSILGFIETLLGGAIDDKEHNVEFLCIIKDHAQRLNALVNDLLSLSKLESKESFLSKEQLGLRKIFSDCAVGFRSLLKERNLKLANNIPQDLSVYADKLKLQQVAANLIDNAVKFNKENGSITIYGEAINGLIKVIVEDSGIGIPEKDIPRIFERFYRVDKARSRDLGGTGLGLSIVKHIIESHGGSVGVESTEGLGSKFFFFLPA